MDGLIFLLNSRIIKQEKFEKWIDLKFVSSKFVSSKERMP